MNVELEACEKLKQLTSRKSDVDNGEQMTRRTIIGD